MKTFKTCLQHVNGLKFIYETLPLQSSVGRKRILQQPFITDACLLQKELNLLEESIHFLQQKKNDTATQAINRILQQIHDISPALIRLEKQQVLDDIELFEIKKFALFTIQIADLLSNSGCQIISIEDVEPVIGLLDPENKRIPHFYIYSAYDAELERLRKKIISASNPEKAEEYRWESVKREDFIRADLSQKLYAYHTILTHNLEQIALLDTLWSKAAQALKFGFCKPVILDKTTSYHQLFNPEIKEILKVSSKMFQPIDIDLYPDSCLITGANMSGKTVLLKTLALSQYLFQFGFYVPTSKAAIVPVDEVALCIGDRQSETNGLSSFATEILEIDRIIKKVKQGKKLLALVDELARTTNPEEGKLIVSAFIGIMSKYKVMSLITTHYSGILTPSRKLRVKGLKTDRITQEITPNTLQDYMNYELVETQEEDVPMEALKIAEIFGVDREFIDFFYFCNLKKS